MGRVPLSVRSSADQSEEYTALRDGVPEWMLASATSWTKQFFFDDHGWGRAASIERAEQYLRLKLEWTGSSDLNRASSAGKQLLALVADEVVGLDLIDFCLSTCYRSDSRPKRLQGILDRSASAWSVGLDDEDKFCLERRVDAAVEAAARVEMAEGSKAAAYLSSAWHLVYGRAPSPSSAYREAVRAIEASARPTVTPRDALATLGKMIAAMNDAPAKWVAVIGDIDTVRLMMTAVWRAQHDRHGTDDESKPANVSAGEAEAAVQYAVAQIHLFRTGAIRLADST